MKKRGQFYLIAAIIFAVIVMGIVAVSNYSIITEPTNVQDLKNQIQIESAMTVDYGISNQLSQAEMYINLSDLAQQYINAESGSKDLYFMFGTSGGSGNITLKGYQKSDENVYLDSNQVTSSSGGFLFSEVPSGNILNLTINQTSYFFSLKDGENFYFLISQAAGGEKDVATG